MPRKEINDYTFYKIININGDVSLCYVGSTVNMKERTRSHKKNCKNPNMPNYHLKVYQTIREHGGWDEFKMIEIGTAEQLTLTEARIIEERYRVELCAELNMLKCHITEEERKERNKLKHQKYQQNHNEAIKQKRRVKIICECGCEICRDELSNHRKRQKHIDLMLKIVDNNNNI